MRKLTLSLIALFMVLGCSRVPNTLHNPKVYFKADIKDNDVYYTMFVKGIILNESSETVYRNIKGEISIRNGSVLATVPFEIPQLLPFKRLTLNVEKSGTESQMKPLLTLFRVDADRLISGGALSFSEELDLKGENFRFSILSYESDNIIDIIKKGKSDENQ